MHDQTHILLIHEDVSTRAQKDNKYNTSASSLGETFHDTSGWVIYSYLLFGNDERPTKHPLLYEDCSLNHLRNAPAITAIPRIKCAISQGLMAFQKALPTY